MQIVTSTRDSIDIDGLACVAAYAELLQKQGKEARGISTAVWNASVTPAVRAWGIPVASAVTVGPDDHFTLVDVSHLNSLDPIVNTDQVSEIIDHHPGVEAFWKEKIGDRAQIEEVGAASTLVVEHWQTAGRLPEISRTCAGLLMCGILDNTLNFKATVTTARDRAAYAALKPLAKLPENLPEQYFNDCQTAILADVTQAIIDDTKVMTFAGWEGGIEFGQLVIWDAAAILEDPIPIQATLQNRNPTWCMNLVSLKDGTSYFICTHEPLKAWLGTLLDLTWNGDTADAGRLWLRKEIAREAFKRAGAETANPAKPTELANQ
jgi:inorganic pyrophosphatase